MAYCTSCGAEVGDSASQCPSCFAAICPTPAPGPTSEPPPLPPVGEGDCLRHPGVKAVCSCSQCAELFCAECVDHPGPAALCGACRGAVGGARSPQDEVEDEWARKTANEALALSIVGMFFCGFILQIIAVTKANSISRLAADKGREVPGLGKVKAVRVMCVLYFVFLVIFTFIKMANLAASSGR